MAPLNELFERFEALRQALPRIEWQPAADVFRTRDGWLVKMELVGVSRKEIEVAVSGRCLRVWGRRRDWIRDEARQCFSLEIAYSSFQREFELPCDLLHVQLTTEYRDGMLLVWIKTGEAGS